MRVSGPTFDAADPVGLADFYARLLGWDIVTTEGPKNDSQPFDAWVLLRSPSGDLKMEFQWDPNYRRPVWPSEPDTQGMMIHIDIGVIDLEAGVAWAVEQGAAVADHQPQADVMVMLDPEGHPFCLFREAKAAPASPTGRAST